MAHPVTTRSPTFADLAVQAVANAALGSVIGAGARVSGRSVRAVTSSGPGGRELIRVRQHPSSITAAPTSLTPSIRPRRNARPVSVRAAPGNPRHRVNAASTRVGSPGNTTRPRPAPRPNRSTRPSRPNRSSRRPPGPRTAPDPAFTLFRPACSIDGTNTADMACSRADPPSPGSNTRNRGTGSTLEGDHTATRSPIATRVSNMPHHSHDSNRCPMLVEAPARLGGAICTCIFGLDRVDCGNRPDCLIARPVPSRPLPSPPSPPRPPAPTGCPDWRTPLSRNPS